MELTQQPSRKRRVSIKAVSAIAAVAIFAQASPALSRICPSPAEQHALQVRMLQTKLMVSALSCNAKPKYNSFVQQFSRELVPHGKNLRRLFYRAYGKKGRYHLNKFVTRLANDESAVRASADSQYCANALALFSRVLNTNNGYIARLAKTLPFTSTHGFSSCQGKQNSFRSKQRRQ